MSLLRNILISISMAVVFLCGAPASAQERTAIRDGFTLPTDRPVRILVFRPDVTVGSQSAGGVEEPNAEWTETARRLLGDSLIAAQAARGNTVVALPADMAGNDAALLADYQSMFKVLVGEVLQYRLFPGNRLPSKRNQLDWTMGPGVSRLAELGGADYGLFFFTHDAYGSAGRKAAQVALAMFGVGISSGVHTGYAGLVDLRTGDLVWVNADLRMGGDVREAEGAARRVEQLLEGFPGRPAPVAAAAN